MEFLLKQFMLAIGVLFVSCSVLGKTEFGPFPCGYNYNADAGGWLKMHDYSVTAKLAQIICELEGAELASPSNEALKDAMVSLMYEHVLILENKDLTSVHTAMNVTGLNHEMDSIALTLPWGELKRVNPDIQLPFICFRRATQFLNKCGTTDPGYTLDKETNKCYKFYSSRNDWFGAELKCFMDGGHLAIINSEKEAETIRKIFEKNPADTIPGVTWKDSAFLGYYATIESNTGEIIWMTVAKQPMLEAGYTDWSPREPNNARGDEYCVSTGRNGKLFDDPCTRRLPFICEKRPDNCITPTAILNMPPKKLHAAPRLNQPGDSPLGKAQLVPVSQRRLVTSGESCPVVGCLIPLARLSRGSGHIQ
ncbi:lectin c-type domain-containing protein [Phthorimaea operculella]|nr:lectin c-type domain-containing protein [Phthorimaea operculella]